MATSISSPNRIQLCGRLKVEINGAHVTPRLRGRQGRVLLAYLVINRNRAVSRDELISAMWPEELPLNPHAALRTQLSRLRDALGAEALAGRETIETRLPSDTWIDIEAAEAALLDGQVEARVGNWRDAWALAHIGLSISGLPFLAGFDAPWVEVVRRELSESHTLAREMIARAGVGLGGSELPRAAKAARELIREAPFRESAYVLLMEALVAQGNTAEAMRAYEQIRRLLADELGTAPGTELQQLHRKLLGEHPGSTPASEGPRSSDATKANAT